MSFYQTRTLGPLVVGDYGEGPGVYQEITIIEWDPISGLGSPGWFKKVFKKVSRAIGKIIPKEVAKVAPIVLPFLAPVAATGILGEHAKKSGKKVLHVVGGAMRIAAPFAAVIPGVGPLAAAGLAAGGTVLGKMMQRDKPLQVFTQPATLMQAGTAVLASTAIGKIAGAMQLASAPQPSMSEYGPTYSAGGEAAAAAYPGGSVGGYLNTIGRVAVTGLQTAQTFLTPKEATPLGYSEQYAAQAAQEYGPGYYESYLPQFPGMESTVMGGAPSGGPATWEPGDPPVPVTAADLFTGPVPLMIAGGVVLLLFSGPSPTRRRRR